MTRKEYEHCIFNQFVQTIIEPISDIQKNIDMYTEQNDGENEKDEMTKKAWYTALALTTKLYCFILCIVFLANAFFNFLNLISASNALLCSLYLILFLSRWCYAYYIHHPEKTWL